MSNVIEIEHLYKSYGEVKAVNDLSFNVRSGQLFAFLGVNGAGKSTTISIICGLLKKNSGLVKIAGEDIDKDSDKIKRKIGVVFQNSALDKQLSVYDNIKSRAASYGIHGEEFKSRLAEITRMFDLGDILKRPVGKLSGGQRRRADVARALIHSPEILILDEPTTGLDPQTRKMLWETVTALRKNTGMTVLLTTHYMEEAADADYVVIIDCGEIAAQGTPIELKNRYTGDFITFYNTEEEAVKSLGIPYEKVGNAFRAEVPSPKEATTLIISHPNVFNDYEITKGKMDDVFLSVTGKKVEEER